MLWMIGSRLSIAREVNAVFMTPRSRVCLGGSVNTAQSPSPWTRFATLACDSAVRCFAKGVIRSAEKRRSSSAFLTSSYRVRTQPPRLSLQWTGSSARSTW